MPLNQVWTMGTGGAAVSTAGVERAERAGTGLGQMRQQYGGAGSARVDGRGIGRRGCRGVAAAAVLARHLAVITLTLAGPGGGGRWRTRARTTPQRHRRWPNANPLSGWAAAANLCVLLAVSVRLDGGRGGAIPGRTEAGARSAFAPLPNSRTYRVYGNWTPATAV